MNIPSFSPCVDDQKHRSPRVNITPNRYGRSLFLQEKERLQTILKKRIEISFLSNTGNVNTCSYTLKQLQDWLVNKMSVWSEQAEVFLVGSVAASVLQETHLSKDIDLRIMLPQTIVDTSKAEFLVTFFLRQYAPKTKQGSWRPIFTVHTAPDRTSCTYQMGAVDLNFRARVPAYLSVNKSDGFVIRLSDQHVFCIDQQTYCSTETSFQEGYHQLTQKIYSIAHFRNLRSIELRILKKATLGHLIPERDYFKEFLTRIQSDYYLADATGKLVAGWFGRKEWLSTYRKHLDTDYPASITGSERLRVYLLDILNLLACVGEVPPVFAERVSTVWRASLSGTRSSLTSPLYFLEHYPEETSLLLQLVQSIACCHYTYCIHEDRLLLNGYATEHGLLMRSGGTSSTMQQRAERFGAVFDQMTSLTQQDTKLLESLQSLFTLLGLPDLSWTETTKTRYVLLLSLQADPLIRQQASFGISSLKEAFFYPTAVKRRAKDQHWSFLQLLSLPCTKALVPSLVAQPEIAKAVEEALSALKEDLHLHHQLIRTIGVFLKYSTISNLPTLQLLRDLLANPLSSEAQNVQAAISDMTKILEIPFLKKKQPLVSKRSQRHTHALHTHKLWQKSLHRIQTLFQSLQNVRYPLHKASAEIQQLAHQAQKNRWVHRKEVNTLFVQLVPFHLQIRHHEASTSFRVLTQLLQDQVRTYEKRINQKEHHYWGGLHRAVLGCLGRTQIYSLPFLSPPKNRLFYIIQAPLSIQRIVSTALQTHARYSQEESLALLQVCVRAPHAFTSPSSQEDLLDFSDFVTDTYLPNTSTEKLYKTLAQLITLLLGQTSPVLQDLGYRLFGSLPIIPRLFSQTLRKAWTQMAKAMFSLLAQREEYEKISALLPPLYQQLDYNHCFGLTLHLQNLTIALHLQLFSQLAETSLTEDNYPNGSIPFPATDKWSPTSSQIHRLIQRLNDGSILYEIYPALLRNAVDLIAGLMIRTPNHSFDLLQHGFETLDRLYQIQQIHHCSPREMAWYPKYNFSFSIHVHHLAALSKNLLPLEGLAPRLAQLVTPFIQEMNDQDVASFIRSILLLFRDFILLSLLKDDPQPCISFIDTTIQPMLEQLRISQHPSLFFISMSKSVAEMCIDLFFLDITIFSIPQIFFPSTRSSTPTLLPSKKPKLSALKKKIASKLAFSTIKSHICPNSKIKNRDLGFIVDAIRYYSYTKHYIDSSKTNEKILIHLYKMIFPFLNRVANEETLLCFRQLWDDVHYNLMINLPRMGNVSAMEEVQKTASQCFRLTTPGLGAPRDSIRTAIEKSAKVKRPEL